jgi:hypothetical protein
MGTDINFSKKLGKVYGTSINIPIVTTPCTDVNSAAFLLAAGITDPVISNAICNLVVGLKADGIWNKMKAVYPFVGGTATTHKFNLKNPLDTNAAFRLSFVGGWTHSSTGAKPNGVNAHANTFITPSIDLLTNYASISYYSRTSDNEIATNGGTVIGVRSDNNATVNNSLILGIKLQGTNYSTFNFTATGTTSNQQARYTDANGTGMYIGRLNGTRGDIYRNGNIQTFENFSYSRSTPNRVVYIGAINNKATAAEYSLKESAFAHIGDSLTDTEISNLNARVQAFQIALGRNV